jgi:hypothetical protein
MDPRDPSLIHPGAQDGRLLRDQVVQVALDHLAHPRRALQDLVGKKPALAREIAAQFQLPPDIAQQLLHRLAVGVHGAQRIEPGHQKLRQKRHVDRLFRGEVVEKVRLRQPRHLGDLVQRRAPEPVLREHLESGIEDVLGIALLDPGPWSGHAYMPAARPACLDPAGAIVCRCEPERDMPEFPSCLPSC